MEASEVRPVTIASGAKILSADIAAAITAALAARVYVEKTANQIKTNNTLVDDNHLFSSVVTSSTYAFELVLFYTTATSATPDMKVALTFPAGCTASWSAIGLETGVTTAAGIVALNAWSESVTSGATLARSATNAGTIVMVIKGRIKTTSTAGVFRLQWAQNTTTAENTTLLAGSHMIIEKVA